MAFNHFFSYASSLLILVVMVATASAKPEYEKPELEKENLLSTIVGIQGLVYCKSGPKVIPLEGIIFQLVDTSLADWLYLFTVVNSRFFLSQEEARAPVCFSCPCFNPSL